MPKEKKDISMSVIKRLPRYYRFLGELKKKDISRISSRELSQMMGFTASQIRQDFNCFGGFGQQGYGYNIEQLIGEFSGILGLNELKSAILIGAGNLGRAVANQMSFEDKGFKQCIINRKGKRLYSPFERKTQYFPNLIQLVIYAKL